MSEWKKVRLGDICKTISDTYNRFSENVVLINTSDVLRGKVLNNVFVPNKNLKGQFKKTFKKNDILYSEIRPKNKRYAFVDFDPIDYIASTKLMVLRADKLVLPKYLYILLSSKGVIEKLQAVAETRSGTFPQITYSELNNLEVNLPSLPEQKRIAEILGALDDKIECNNRINANLEEQAQALFKRWFVDFEFPDEKGNPYSSSGGEMIDSELGKIPKGWTVGKLSDIIDIKSGYAFKSDTFSDFGDYRLITIKGVQDGYLEIGKSVFIKEIPKNMPNYCKLQIEDILLSLTGNVGRVCVVYKNNLLLNQRVCILSPNDKEDKVFIYTLFRQNSIKRVLEQMAIGTAQLNLSPIEMAKMEMIIPNKDIRNLYYLKAVSFFRMQLIIKIENEKLAQQRDTLLPKLMNNEIKL